MNKLDIFEQNGSNYVGIASFRHYQTAGADVEAALKDGIFQFLGLPLRPRRRSDNVGKRLYQRSLIRAVQKCQPIITCTYASNDEQGFILIDSLYG